LVPESVVKDDFEIEQVFPVIGPIIHVSQRPQGWLRGLSQHRAFACDASHPKAPCDQSASANYQRSEISAQGQNGPPCRQNLHIVASVMMVKVRYRSLLKRAAALKKPIAASCNCNLSRVT
jgi:hypothetical protein